MNYDRLHALKDVPPIPAEHDETAAFIRQAILDLSRLLTGGAGIAAAIDRAANGDLQTVNPHANIAAGLHHVALNLNLANIAAVGPGKLDDQRLTRDLAFIRAAFTRHHEEGTCEIAHPANPLHAPAHVSAADDLEEAGGAYVQAWVWVDLEDVDSGHLEDAAADLKVKSGSKENPLQAKFPVANRVRICDKRLTETQIQGPTS